MSHKSQNDLPDKSLDIRTGITEMTPPKRHRPLPHSGDIHRPRKSNTPGSLPLLCPCITGSSHPEGDSFRLLPLFGKPFNVIHIFSVAYITGTLLNKSIQRFEILDPDMGKWERMAEIPRPPLCYRSPDFRIVPVLNRSCDQKISATRYTGKNCSSIPVLCSFLISRSLNIIGSIICIFRNYLTITRGI